MNTKLVHSKNIEEKIQTVNKAIRICVNCGSLSVHIENYGIFCKECDMFFVVKEGKNWSRIPVEVFVDITMQTPRLETLG